MQLIDRAMFVLSCCYGSWDSWDGSKHRGAKAVFDDIIVTIFVQTLA